MVRPSSPAWAWFTVINCRGREKAHPDVRCNFCPKRIDNAMLSRGLLPHIVNCVGAPSSVIVQAQRMRDAANRARAVRGSPARRNPVSRRLSVTPTRPRRPNLVSTGGTTSLGTGDAGATTSPSALDIRDPEAVRTQIAKAVFSSGIPFRVVENPEVKLLLQALAPPGGVPNRRSLATTLLDRVYATAKEQARAIIGHQDHLTVVTDGWSNLHNQGMVNFVLVAPGMRPVFWKSVATGGNQHTGDYYATLTGQLIDEVEAIVGRGKIVCVNSDNASNMLAAWDLLQEDRSQMLSHGCAAHAINLLIQAIFEHIDDLGAYLAQCVAVAKFVKKRQGMLARVGDEQFDQETRRALALPVPTRWYTQETCIKSVMRNEEPLKRAFQDDILMARYTGAKSLPSVQASINDVTFWAHGSIVLNLLDPVTDALALLEKDDTSISMVNECFSRLTENAMYTQGQFGVSTEIQDDILYEIKHRWRKARSPAVDVAYLLDPRLKIGSFAQLELIELIETAVRLAQRTEALNQADTRSMRLMISSFVEEKMKWTDSQREQISAYSPTQWWGFRPHFAELARFAKKLLSIPASSAASERSWSVHNFIQSKTRSRLLPTRLSKLAFVYSNMAKDKHPRLMEEDLEFVMNSQDESA